MLWFSSKDFLLAPEESQGCTTGPVDGEALTDGEALGLVEGEPLGVGVADAVGDPVGVGDADAVGDGEVLTVGVGVGATEVVGVGVG
jgi:hypothetical protein